MCYFADRWYFLQNGEKAAIVKTLGGAIEVEIPIDQFLKINLDTNFPLYYLKSFLNKKEEITIPENYAIMVPKEVKEFLINRKEYKFSLKL